MHKNIKYSYSTLVFLFSCFFSVSTSAQEYLANDTAFFAEKTKYYQYWLEKNELSNYLKVDSFHIAREGYELELFMQFLTSNADTAINIWKTLEQQYQPTSSDFTLKESLYNHFVQFMEIPPLQGNIQIKIASGNGTYLACPYVYIWEEDAQIIDEKDYCKSETIDIALPLNAFSTSRAETEVDIPSSKSIKWFFEKIVAYAKTKYQIEKPNCEPRIAEVLPPAEFSDTYLEFYVNDLCQEILIHEERSYWCKFIKYWGRDCNDMRRERLEFKINASKNDDVLFLKIEIIGKFGSGIYKPRGKGWLDMTPDFDDYLQDYALKFKEELGAFLLKSIKKD